MTRDCECPLSGYCQRHKMTKGAHLYHLCQTRADYRELWDKLAKLEALKQKAAKKPGFIQKAKSYLCARKKWTAAGKPVRSAERVLEIFETICKPCEYFKPAGDNGKCGKCGCDLKLKIRMATEECPIGKWRAE